MRGLTLALSIAGLSLLTLPVVISGPSQAQGPTFKLELCSAFGKPVLLSILHRVAPNDQRYMVKGWFMLEKQGQCASGDLPRGIFGTFAFSRASDTDIKTWGGTGDNLLPICVNVSKPFERILTDNYKCQEENKEFLLPFEGRKVTNEPGVKIVFR